MNTRPSRLPLHRFPLISTGDLRNAQETLVNAFGARAFSIADSAENLHIVKNHLRLKCLDVSYGSFAAAVDATFPEVDLIKQHFSLSGAGLTRFGHTQFSISENATGVIPAGVEINHRYDAAFSQIMLRIRAGALQEKLGALLGHPVGRSIEFAVEARFDVPEMDRLRRIVHYFVSELDHDDATMPEVALAEFEQLVIVSFLTGNRHNFSSLLERTHTKPAPWQVRMIEEYVEANWDKALDIETLSAVTGGSARSIFTAFRAARGISPMAFAKSVRLRRAREMLQRPEPSTSVISVSFRCGFHNPGHFARDYRNAFGELPSRTLMSSRHYRGTNR